MGNVKKCYRTSDGEVYSNLNRAESHQNLINRESIIDDIKIIANSSTKTFEETIIALIIGGKLKPTTDLRGLVV